MSGTRFGSKGVCIEQHIRITREYRERKGFLGIKSVYFLTAPVLVCVIMSGGRIQTYILREVLSPTLLCLLIFTMVLLMGRLMKLVDLVVNKGVSFGDILILFGTMLPAFLNITLPLSFLMGIMIGLSRLSTDSETVAMKAAGIGLAQMARPILVLALLFALLTAFAGLWLKPWGFKAFREQVFAITMQKATIGFQPRVFMNQFSNMVLYANTIEDRSGLMKGLFIVEQKPDATMLIFADQGQVVSDPKEETVTIRLQDGTIHRQQAYKDTTYQLIHFRHYDVQPDLTGDRESLAQKAVKGRRPKEMATAELWQQIPDAATHDADRSHAMLAELHTRLATPLAPLIFALFGLPFSIQSHRSGRSGGFVIGLIIYLCYYLMLSLGQTFTADAGLTPIATFWIPHLVLIVLGLYCLYQSAHERPNIIVTWVEHLLIAAKNRINRIHEHA